MPYMLMLDSEQGIPGTN